MQFEANAFDSGEKVCKLLDSRMCTAGPGSASAPMGVLFFLSFSGLQELSPCLEEA